MFADAFTFRAVPTTSSLLAPSPPAGGGLFASTPSSGSNETSPSDHAILFANYGYNDSEIRDTDEDGNPQAFAGNRFAFSPRHTFSIGAELAAPIAEGWSARLTPIFSWQSAVFFDDENRPANSQDAYGVLNANFEIGPDNGRWAVTAGVENALNKTYAIDGGSLSNAFGIPALYVGPPRLWRVGVEVEL